MIADAEKKKELLQQLQNSTTMEDKTKLETIHWKDTFQEANGIRQKNNVTKLKQQQKRIVAKKKKSTKQWNSRVEQIATATTERQQIRTHNLTTRQMGGSVGANLSKKEMKTTTGTNKKNDVSNSSTNTKAKPQQQRAGFEGRKNHFLNSPSPSTSGTNHHTKKSNYNNKK